MLRHLPTLPDTRVTWLTFIHPDYNLLREKSCVVYEGQQRKNATALSVSLALCARRCFEAIKKDEKKDEIAITWQDI